MSEHSVEIDARREAAEQIAAWSSPSGWIAQQAVVAYLQDGDCPQPWELDGPRWSEPEREVVRLLINNLTADAFHPDCASRIRRILDRAGYVIPRPDNAENAAQP